MGFWEPYMKGHEPCLGAEADQSQEKGHSGGSGKKNAPLEGAELKGPAAPCPEEEEKDQEKGRSDMGGDQVGPSRPPYHGILLLEEDEKEGGEGHDLPSQKEEKAVSGRYHHEHADDESVEVKPVLGEPIP